MSLFPYQQRIAEAGARYFLSAVQMPSGAMAHVGGGAMLRRALEIVAPTGSGKTRMVVDMTRRVVEGSALPVVWFWLAPFSTVIDQTAEVIDREAGGLLRRRDPATDRRVEQLRSGDIFLATTSSLVATKGAGRLVHQESEQQATLEEMVHAVRRRGWRIGLVVDEAHHGMVKASAKSAQSLVRDLLQPDYAILVTATPKDTDVRVFLQQVLQNARHEDLAVSRSDVIQAGLIKPRIDLVSFLPAEGLSSHLVDLAATALRQGVRRHQRLAQELRAQGIAMAPLTLVQCATHRRGGGDAVEWTKQFLIEQLGVRPSAIAIHTADEPDVDLLAKARDPRFAEEGGTEFILFKQAIAQGFDAPRAFILIGLRTVQDVDFGVQILGRVMRQHPAIRERVAMLDSKSPLRRGYVLLADPEAQGGLQGAAKQLRELASDYNANEDTGRQEAVFVNAEQELAGRLSQMTAGGQVVQAPVEMPLDLAAAADEGGADQSLNLGMAMPVGLGGDMAMGLNAEGKVGVAEGNAGVAAGKQSEARRDHQQLDVFDSLFAVEESEIVSRALTAVGSTVGASEHTSEHASGAGAWLSVGAAVTSSSSSAGSGALAASSRQAAWPLRRDLEGVPERFLTVRHLPPDEAAYERIATRWGPPAPAVEALLRQEVAAVERSLVLLDEMGGPEKVAQHGADGIEDTAIQAVGAFAQILGDQRFPDQGRLFTDSNLATEVLEAVLADATAAALAPYAAQGDPRALYWLATPERLAIAVRVLVGQTGALIRTLLREDSAARQQAVPAAPLPASMPVKPDDVVVVSRKSLYGHVPARVQKNSWERAFVQWCETCDDVVWWFANEPKTPWGVSLIVPGESGLFWPDFAIGLRDTTGAVQILLVDPKDLTRLTQVPKAGALHPAYGQVRMISVTRQGLYLAVEHPAGHFVPAEDVSQGSLLGYTIAFQ